VVVDAPYLLCSSPQQLSRAFQPKSQAGKTLFEGSSSKSRLPEKKPSVDRL